MAKKISVLLVEGEGDVDFFEALLRKLQLLDQIDITPPKSYGLKTNTVSHFPKLIKIFINQLKGYGEIQKGEGKIQHLGIVADADYVSGGGFQQRWKTLTTPLAENQYRIPQNPPTLPYSGSIFYHSNGLPPIGLWLMPNHQSDGMLEDLIEQTVYDKTLLAAAQTCIEKLPSPLFSPYHHTKAMVYTWLAWQKRPGQTLDITINGDLLNLDSKEMKAFIKWLRDVF